jgi:ATP synthase protein I
MDDDEAKSSDRLKALRDRLASAQASIEERDRPAGKSGSAYSFGFRLATDLIAGVLAGFGIGWGLDKWLGTSPWFLLIFTVLGMIAGIVNVIRAAKSAEARRHLEATRADNIPSVPDEDD